MIQLFLRFDINDRHEKLVLRFNINDSHGMTGFKILYE